MDGPQIVEENGLKVITEYRINEDGKKVKSVRKVRMVMHKQQGNHAIAERSRWKKFGVAANSSSFEDGSTVLTEPLQLVLADLKTVKTGVIEQKPQQEKKVTNTTIICRVCKGDHWTTKCPYKDTLGNLDALLDKPSSAGTSESATGEAPGSSKGGPAKWVPPSLRARAAGGPSSGGGPSGGESTSSFSRRYDDLPSLRVSNLPEDTTDEDLHMLFGKFGPMARCFLATDRETGRFKGFAYISYRSKPDAERALQVMNGRGFANLILEVQWSQPRS